MKVRFMLYTEKFQIKKILRRGCNNKLIWRKGGSIEVSEVYNMEEGWKTYLVKSVRMSRCIEFIYCCVVLYCTKHKAITAPLNNMVASKQQSNCNRH